MKYKDLEKLFRDKLIQHSEPVNVEEVWASVESELPSRKRDLRFLIWLLPLLMSAGVFTYLYFSQMEDNNKYYASANEPKLTNNMIRTADSKMETNATDYANTKGVASKNIESDLESILIPQEQSVEPSIRSTPVFSALAHKNILRSDSKPTQESITGLAMNTASELENRIEEFDTKVEYRLLEHLKSRSFLDGIGQNLNPEMPELLSSQVFQRFMHFAKTGVEFGFLNSQFKGAWIPDSGYGKIEGQHNFSLFALLGKRLGKSGIRIYSGIQYTQHTSILNFERTFENLEENNDVLVATFLHSDGQESFEYGTKIEKETIKRNYETNQLVQSWEIPIWLEYPILSSKKIDFLVQTGVQAVVSRSFEGYLPNHEAQEPEDHHLVQKSADSDGFGYGLRGGFSLSYKMTGRMNMDLSPSFIWYADQELGEENLKYGATVAGVNLAFSYKF